MAQQRTPYSLKGETIALLTRHGKERVIAPRFESTLGCHIEVVDGFDTDQLGTFTREIPRAGTQIEAARQKARIGMTLSGARYGLASEGAFGPDPAIGLLPWNVEYLMLIDDVNGLEWVGRAQGPARQAHRKVTDLASLLEFASEAGFPDHHLVLRPDDEHTQHVVKGICNRAALESAFAAVLSQSAKGVVFVETDLRAHANPTRMEMIALAANDLLAQLASRCPVCETPGFGLVERIPGLPCADCGAPTRETRAEVHGCIRCLHRETRSIPGGDCADPAVCDWCNP